MLKRVLIDMPDGLLWGTAHDSVVLEVAPAAVHETAAWGKRCMERCWPQMKWAPYYPDGFFCRVEAKVGKNWRDMEEVTI